jgi:flagellin
MALNLNTNIASLQVQDSLSRTSDTVNNTMARLASGLRINSAKDDAAGMQISSRLSTQIKGMTVAIRNAGDAISIAQSAEQGLQKTTNTLQRMRMLTIQSQNGSNGPKDRAALNAEFQQSLQEITRASRTVRFGTDMQLMDGSAGILTFQVGANAGADEKISLSLDQSFSSESLFVAAESSAAVASSATTTGSKAIVAGVYTALAIDGTGSRNVGNATANKALDDATEGLKKAKADLAAAPAPSDPAAPTPEYVALQTTLETAQTMFDSAKKAVDDDFETNKPLYNDAIRDNLDATLKAIDAALEKINAARADIGAKQNRLHATIGNLTSMLQNNTAARGRIQDVDYAAETAELTRSQTLQQASIAILAQANQLPAAILKLLQ